MTISEYNDLVARYNAAWHVVTAYRQQMQQADVYLASYGLVHNASELHLRVQPRARINGHWPTSTAILDAVASLKELGEQVAAAYNELRHRDRYVVKLPLLVI